MTLELTTLEDQVNIDNIEVQLVDEDYDSSLEQN